MSRLQRTLMGDRSASSDLTLVQWNVLADGLAHRSFTHATAACLDWTTRAERILDLLGDGLPESPDVVCLQEVDRYPSLAHELEARGYTGVFEPKAKDRDGCCLFVREARYRLIEARPLRYVHDDGAPMTQLALVACVEPVSGGDCVWIATTHLKAKPGHETLRATQGRQLLDALPRDEPVIVAGDFNDVPGSPVHALFAERLASACRTVTGAEAEWTTWKIRAAGEVKRTIDYVWHSAHLRPLAWLDVPTDAAVGPHALPSDRYPSDHLSLAVRFRRTP